MSSVLSSGSNGTHVESGPGSVSESAAVGSWAPGRPNILVTGTPGVGKTHVCGLVAHELGLRHIEVGAFAKARDLLSEHDAEHDAYYMHEDAVLDELEGIMSQGGVILDHHSCDWFPERWIQVAAALHTRTDVLYDRLTARGYAGTKLDSNMEAEIMQVVAEEAIKSYPKLDVLRLNSNEEEDCDQNVAAIKEAFRKAEKPCKSGDEDVIH